GQEVPDREVGAARQVRRPARQPVQGLRSFAGLHAEVRPVPDLLPRERELWAPPGRHEVQFL
ncbi:MAG: SSU ribosomal protein S14p (S29e) @ SSU ribosomal protein S14p (S29e), zinc-dependent, partial [uncultured Thermomicrobiales bacterium]